MRNITVYFSALFTLLLLLACGSEKKQSPDRADSLAADSAYRDSSQALQTENIPAKAPEWFRHLPVNEDRLYARGTAVSTNRAIAGEKALFKAQTRLAGLLRKQNNTTGAGANAVVDRDSVSKEIDLSGYRILKEQKVQDGKKWRAYVLLELILEKDK